MASRVAVLSDVHGNAVALEAVVRELEAERIDLHVFGGDLTWGSLPEETWALAAELRPAIFVRGNAERALAELAAGEIAEPTERELWMLESHSKSLRARLAKFVEQASVEVDGLGAVRFCHGSPRSDEECVTPATPEQRMRSLLAGVDERVIVTAHTHIQFDREVVGVRSVNPGSIGMPYEGEPGAAFWAILGPDVELRRTEFDVEEAVRRYRETDDPSVEQMVELLLRPPTREELIEDAETREFAG